MFRQVICVACLAAAALFLAAMSFMSPIDSYLAAAKKDSAGKELKQLMARMPAHELLSVEMELAKIHEEEMKKNPDGAAQVAQAYIERYRALEDYRRQKVQVSLPDLLTIAQDPRSGAHLLKRAILACYAESSSATLQRKNRAVGVWLATKN